MLSPHSSGLVREFLLTHVGVKSVTKGKNWLTLWAIYSSLSYLCALRSPGLRWKTRVWQHQQDFLFSCPSLSRSQAYWRMAPKDWVGPWLFHKARSFLGASQSVWPIPKEASFFRENVQGEGETAGPGPSLGSVWGPWEGGMVFCPLWRGNDTHF